MAQGEFTKQEARATIEAATKIFRALSDRKQGEFLGRWNDVFLFLEAAKRNAPDESEVRRG